MISPRQEKLLNFLIKEYITTAEPVSSKALKKVADLDVCGATVRNDLQALTKEGYIEQPHTSAGRIPTKKAYKYLSDKLEASETNVVRISIVRQVTEVHNEIEHEMKQMEELMRTLEQDNLFDILNILERWHKNQI